MPKKQDIRIAGFTCRLIPAGLVKLDNTFTWPQDRPPIEQYLLHIFEKERTSTHSPLFPGVLGNHSPMGKTGVPSNADRSKIAYMYVPAA
jgi:hypothetical protein